MKTLIALTVAIFSLGSAVAESSHEELLIAQYLKVSDALYKDNLADAKTAAAAIPNHSSSADLLKAAKAVSESPDLATARVAFKSLSAEAIKLANPHIQHGVYTVMKCPMVKGGNGVWLTSGSVVNNPYFGAAMPHCGGPVK